MGTLIVGFVFAAVLYWAGRKAYVDMKKGKCSGCSSCGPEKYNSCQFKN